MALESIARNYEGDGPHYLKNGDIKDKALLRKQKTIDDYLNKKSIVRRFSMIDDQIGNVL